MGQQWVRFARTKIEINSKFHLPYTSVPSAWLVLYMQVLLVHLSQKPLQLRTALETNLEICLGVLTDRNRKGKRWYYFFKGIATFYDVQTKLAETKIKPRKLWFYVPQWRCLHYKHWPRSQTAERLLVGSLTELPWALNTRRHLGYSARWKGVECTNVHFYKHSPKINLCDVRKGDQVIPGRLVGGSWGWRRRTSWCLVPAWAWPPCFL